MLNPNQKFHYKYRLIHFVIGSIVTILVIGLAINRFYPIADKAPLNRTIDPLLILSFTALQACEFFYFAIGTYIQVTPHDIRIKVPFIRINSSWQNIEGFDAIVMPKSVYTEPGFIFREPPFQKTTFIKRLFLPELINNKALPVSPYLRDKEIKELELLVKWQLKQTSL